MNALTIIFTIVQLLSCVFLIAVVLLQSGKSSGLSSAAKKVVIGGVAGLFIACCFWFLSGIAPEFRLKKEEEMIRKEVAE